MNNVIIENIPRIDGTIARQLAQLGVATVHEAMGRVSLMHPYLRPLYEGAQIAGPAVTVLVTPGDNWMIHVACEVCRPGDVLVVACTAHCTDGMVGDLLTTFMQARGLAGLIIDAGCRDVSQIRSMRFPVWSKAISAQGTVKATPGSVNIPVVCAGSAVLPGDIVVADDDGVVVVPRGQADAVLRLGRERMERELVARERLANGGLPAGASGAMRDRLIELGVTWIDTSEAAAR
ncbi:4-carboxy-4-hydroxy-2-oxoadipate aldolase/oxaloacetate decarboxylase [Paraburkholderia graminis]|uniref:4-carboxy-4-hydroxy-2-oxoadipate aldolase/oxaloacetate decarboxylase n=1 Tax=Paraburkholderia graminis TaxID=60548 RepID=UPI0038B848F0